MTRQTRADSIAAATETARRVANANLSWPLAEGPCPATAEFFASLVDEIPASEWTAHKLELAAITARSMADLEAQQRALRTEGAVIQTARGTPTANPRGRIAADLLTSILAARRSLGLHATARSRDLGRLARRRELTHDVEDAWPDDPDGLLA
jgi:hypothetical protein